MANAGSPNFPERLIPEEIFDDLPFRVDPAKLSHLEGRTAETVVRCSRIDGCHLMNLNLGCCDRPFPGFIGVDIAPGPHVDQVCDLRGPWPWPWPDSSVDEVVAHDVFEHLPDRIHTMNELWRVLKPGARATIEVPSASKGAGFAQDPTHVSPWCMNSFQYFEDGSFAHKRLAGFYGIMARFKVLSLTEREYDDVHEPVWKITAVLEAVK